MNLTSQPVYEKHKQRKRAVVNDEKYLAWLRKQKSAYSGKWPTQAAHYRTSANSGIGFKPPFSAIPLTAAEHREQHRVGTFTFASKHWWESQVARHQRLFIAQGGVIPEKYQLKGI